LAINTRHVLQQFERRLDRADPEFLYGEVARRLFDRLKLIRLDAQHILDAGCGTGLRTALLRERFPKAHVISLDQSAALLARLRHDARLGAWSQRWARWRQLPLQEVCCADLASTGLAPASLDLVWSNLAIHWHDRPHDVLKEWARLIRPNGLVLFSGWGPATGIELRQALAQAGLASATLPLVDMHDLGDLMVQQGFADPVMDQETLTLTYDQPAALLTDAWALGGNPNPNRRASLVGRQWREQLMAALEKNRNTQTGKLTLTIEVAYGHAWRSTSRRMAGETHISLEAIGKSRR
jgi:malonyl-CoA O-methyltransferase